MSGTVSVFKEINNAVLDLQSSDFQSYERPLRRLAKALDSPALAEVNAVISQGIDVDALLKKGAETGGGMIGSSKLDWPDDQREYLGCVRELLRRFAENPEFALNFGYEYFHAGNKIISGLHSMVRQMVIPFVRDYEAFALSLGQELKPVVPNHSKRVFIVHGHDEGPREAVARFLTNAGLEPLILFEQASGGKTVIEKIEAHKDVGFAVVLMTPDDEGGVKGSGKLEPRARQNVLLELGFFMGHLGRSRVFALVKEGVETPSDFAGVVWGLYDANHAWKQILARELDEAGYHFDWKKAVG
ncbi:Predicted nucleotide-binding protein containing TIR-like domain-containing protein [Luteibacter sp. UNCMF331Sha3.1]|uniref:TIR domain-containing protein n=1 Tax=Luteibacter sp. UNCMF331Sha3.1 TaxID=1502760 RepID=UPI0008D3BF86|nr:nucleotide-binding protein [Luteibacter sp. UNCMF331Sha3.1]SEN05416.1 Predicted nucleotide-binding protein containing TIR-like domain-containing protein [Luteibacter sp. UNCMF331Sha3.1]